MLGGSEEGGRRFEDFVGPTQLRDLTTQPFHLRGLPGGHTGEAAGADFGLPYPSAQRLGGADAQFPRHSTDSGPLGLAVRPHRTGTRLGPYTHADVTWLEPPQAAGRYQTRCGSPVRVPRGSNVELSARRCHRSRSVAGVCRQAHHEVQVAARSAAETGILYCSATTFTRRTPDPSGCTRLPVCTFRYPFRRLCLASVGSPRTSMSATWCRDRPSASGPPRQQRVGNSYVTSGVASRPPDGPPRPAHDRPRQPWRDTWTTDRPSGGLG
jgi:hypothetical protein